MATIVLDASAVLALLLEERGADLVADTLPVAAVSAVNSAEVASRLADKGMSEQMVETTLDNLGLDIVPFDRDSALSVGVLRAPTRDHGLSLGDRACLALARKLGVPALTADRTWTQLDLGVEVRLIRE